MERIIIGISGASGIPLIANVLRNLQKLPDLETHIIISRQARLVCQNECNISFQDLEQMATFVYAENNFCAGPASGSWQANGMLICPCSMRTLAAIATGMGDNLIHRAADVTLKERRPLIIVPRESPLNLVHLRNMVAATEAGAVIMPFMPAFYTRKYSFEEMAAQFTGRILDLLRISHNLCVRWQDDSQSAYL